MLRQMFKEALSHALKPAVYYESLCMKEFHEKNKSKNVH